MVFDAHDRAFALFKGTCRRGMYDNMKTAMETIFVGKQRLFNRRFLQMCSHYLVEPVAARRHRDGGRGKSRTKTPRSAQGLTAGRDAVPMSSR
jgi:transposase